MRVTGTINGRAHTLDVEPPTLLLDLLRELGYTGAKPSCEMEVCGSCAVQLDGLPVSACTTLAVELDGSSVETVEGLASSDDALHPVQRAFLQHSAFQCGFCTPGMIMSAKALLESNPSPSRDEVVHWLEGSICRCTGYEPIVDAVLEAAEAVRNG
jgi:carbon-monoxide dehydrogenase small subunit